MTLRAWLFILVVGVYLLMTSGANASEPGVWEQMQTAPNQIVKGKIQSLELAGDKVLVEVKTGKELKKFTLCSDPAQIPFDRPRQDKLNLLKDAFKNGDSVDLGLTGPWSPCLNTVRVFKGA